LSREDTVGAFDYQGNSEERRLLSKEITNGVSGESTEKHHLTCVTGGKSTVKSKGFCKKSFVCQMLPKISQAHIHKQTQTQLENIDSRIDTQTHAGSSSNTRL